MFAASAPAVSAGLVCPGLPGDVCPEQSPDQTVGNSEVDEVAAVEAIIDVFPVKASFFGAVDTGRGDRLVAFGWAMAEDLAAGKLAR